MRLCPLFVLLCALAAPARADETTAPSPPGTTTPPPGAAQPPPITPEEFDRSRQEYDAGAHAYERGEYDAALAHFQAAYKLAPSPELFFNIGRCHERLGRWAAAADAYERYLAAKPTVEDAVQIRERISDLKLRAHEAARLLTPAPPPAPVVTTTPAPRPSLRVPALALAAVTVALAAGGTGAYLSEWSDYRARRDACQGACSPAEVDALRTRVQSAEVAGGVLWALAGAALVADVVLWIAEARRPHERWSADRGALGVRF